MCIFGASAREPNIWVIGIGWNTIISHFGMSDSSEFQFVIILTAWITFQSIRNSFILTIVIIWDGWRFFSVRFIQLQCIVRGPCVYVRQLSAHLQICNQLSKSTVLESAPKRPWMNKWIYDKQRERVVWCRICRCRLNTTDTTNTTYLHSTI